ncbi:MAG: glycerophosphodiester phosphodiesterase family protein [Aurantimonas endophytica]|uniref:glycerophosphodiester phosphodiesterase family protein n=1 Tax=Aurantimonas endophytica TaxID=1522175 RepID=UPI003002E2B2
MFGGGLEWLVRRPIAHRGLHDGNRSIAENSLPAARAAIAAGYAIECDVQLSADGTPYIFHDDTLDRLTGRAGAFRETDDTTLGGLALIAGGAAIPPVADFLALVDGAVPVVMELKGISAEADAGYIERLRPALSGYLGELALMSFDPWLIDQLLEAGLSYPVGLTAEGTEPEALRRHQEVVERGCDFVSYNVHHLPNEFVQWVRSERGAPVITWTVRSPADAAQSARYADQITFEGFAPQH